MDISREVAKKVLLTVDKGLVHGLGVNEPGAMCVEAAVCYALGLPHGDNPPCVGTAVRAFKIRLNDSRWPTNEDRAAGMRKLAIAQLGSNEIDQRAFVKIVVRETIKQIVPKGMRAAAKLNPNFADEIEATAKQCEEQGTRKAVGNARNVMCKVRDAAAAAIAAAAGKTPKQNAARLEILNLMAKIGLDALIELKSQGCEYLDLCE